MKITTKTFHKIELTAEELEILTKASTILSEITYKVDETLDTDDGTITYKEISSADDVVYQIVSSKKLFAK